MSRLQRGASPFLCLKYFLPFLQLLSPFRMSQMQSMEGWEGTRVGPPSTPLLPPADISMWSSRVTVKRKLSSFPATTRSGQEGTATEFPGAVRAPAQHPVPLGPVSPLRLLRYPPRVWGLRSESQRVGGSRLMQHLQF